MYIPITRRYTSYKGLSERLIKRRLERAGWEVWRGGFIHALRCKELYPNVRKKYARLLLLLKFYYPDYSDMCEYFSQVQKGMPDFICYRAGKFKFVECKLGHEQLSKRQKKCIVRLQGAGFIVEIHKIVFSCTKERRSRRHLYTKEKIVLERQLRLKLRWKCKL